jgi:hypothetical protein
MTSFLKRIDSVEWRVNSNLSNERRMYWDLFNNGVYQHAWICLEQSTGKYALHTWDATLGEYDTFSQAEEHIIAVAVVNRFRQARWG